MKTQNNCRQIGEVLASVGIELPRLPKWLANFAPQGEAIRGHNAAVIILEAPECFPHQVVLKVLPQWDGQSWFHPALFSPSGRRTDQPAGSVEVEGVMWYLLLEEHIDFDTERPGLPEFLQKLRAQGLEPSDPGSGPGIGYGAYSRAWKVADRDSLGRPADGVHSVEQAFSLHPEEFEARSEAVEDLVPLDRFSTVPEDGHFTDEEMEEAARLFGEDAESKLESCLDLLTDGDSDEETVLATLELLCGGNEEVARQQVRFGACVGRRQGRELSRWARRLAGR